jgi:putative nucleotidyltransferase with HDIG domain
MQDKDIAPEILRQANKIVRMRLALADATHPAVAAVLEQAVLTTAREMVKNPDRFELRPLPATPQAQTSLGTLEEAARKAKLPPLPQLLLELQKVMNDPESSAADMARVISKDPKLTATLLRIVNSAMFNFPSQIETVSRAVAVVGMKQLSTLASGTLLLSMFQPDPYGLVDLESFWKHSIAVGIFARALAVKLKLEEPERLFVAGLLHDIGWMALANAYPEAVIATLNHAREQGIDLASAEREVLGFDHAVFGAFLLRKWNFPLLLITGVAFHHDPARGAKYAEPRILHLANFVANAMSMSAVWTGLIQPLDTETWDSLGLKGAHAKGLLQETAGELQSTLSILIQNPKSR